MSKGFDRDSGGPADPLRRRFIHGLAAGLYGLLREDRWTETGGSIERWIADAAARGRLAPAVLHPAAAFLGEQKPAADDIHAMHHEAHEQCFIANSVKSEVRCEPILMGG